MKFNNNLTQYALKHNLHVEYFIWVYLRSLNDTGLHNVSDLNHPKITQSSMKRKLKNNIFFSISNEKIILHSAKSFPLGRRYFSCDFIELNKFARKLAHGSGNLIKGWNSTTIKYLLICIIACQYGDERPYALHLIKEDTNCSVTTIQRALKSLFVDRIFVQQALPSQRSYYLGKKLISFSPNFNKMLIGKTYTKK